LSPAKKLFALQPFSISSPKTPAVACWPVYYSEATNRAAAAFSEATTAAAAVNAPSITESFDHWFIVFA
jgi:hypothetical protein